MQEELDALELVVEDNSARISNLEYHYGINTVAYSAALKKDPSSGFIYVDAETSGSGTIWGTPSYLGAGKLQITLISPSLISTRPIVVSGSVSAVDYGASTKVGFFGGFVTDYLITGSCQFTVTIRDYGGALGYISDTGKLCITVCW